LVKIEIIAQADVYETGLGRWPARSGAGPKREKLLWVAWSDVILKLTTNTSFLWNNRFNFMQG